VLPFSVTIRGRSMCNVSRYCDNNGVYTYIYIVLAVIVTIMTITWRSIGSVNSYCDNNCDV
jgi:hypothetical protein